ncbi:MAG: ATP synthase F1 subunit gamma [Thermotogaceae bacterium]|nr:ATP synthase F1 subunit gamma [Thermotogaceae bacterium]
MSKGKLRAIKKKVEATRNLMKITKAMEMVARAKVSKLERAFKAFKEYAEEIERMKEKILVKGIDSPLFNGVGDSVIILITSDLGLCGAYNSELLKTAEEESKRIADFKGFITIGTKGATYFKKSKFLIEAYERLYDFPTVEVSSMIVDKVMEMVRNEGVGKVKVIYSEFKNALIQRPKVINLLPLSSENADENMEFEPAIEKMIDEFVYFYLTSKLQRLMFEAKVSEYYARQNAMKNATDNANEMIRALTLEYNKARQASITQEIIEIVNGAEALKEIEEAG